MTDGNLAVERLVAQARVLLSVGRTAEAEACLVEALSIDAHSYDATVELAHCQIQAGRRSEALKTAEHAARIEPMAHYPHYLRAHLLIGGRGTETRRALDAARLAVRLGPAEPATHMVLAEALSLARKHRAARASAEEAIRLAPDEPVAHQTLGYVLIRARQWAAGESSLRHALALDPELRSARTNLSTVLRRSGRADEALHIDLSLITDEPANPDHIDALVDHAEAYIREGPVNRASRLMWNLAILRIPILIAALLAPFAYVERRRRIRSLPGVSWDDVRNARSIRKRATRSARWRHHAIIVAIMIVGLITIFFGMHQALGPPPNAVAPSTHSAPAPDEARP